MSVTSSWTSSRNTLALSSSKTLTPNDEVVIEAGPITIANGSTDSVVNVGGVDVSQLVHAYIHSTKAVTIETNATDATGGNTISLAADVPLLWCTGAPFTNPITADITAVYVTNSSGSAATINMRFVQDGTP